MRPWQGCDRKNRMSPEKQPGPLSPGQAQGLGPWQDREGKCLARMAFPKPSVKQAPGGGVTAPLTSRFFLADNYLLKNGTSDVLLCGNSSDAG